MCCSIPDESTIDILWDEFVSNNSDNNENIKWLELAEDVVLFIERRSSKRKRRYPHKRNASVLDCVCHLAVKHLKTFGSIFNRLKVSEINYLETFYGIADETCYGDSYTWAHLITLLTFAEYMARSVPSKYETFGKVLGIYIVTRMRVRIEQLGGWKSFITFCNKRPYQQQSTYPNSSNSFTGFCTTILYFIVECFIAIV